MITFCRYRGRRVFLVNQIQPARHVSDQYDSEQAVQLDPQDSTLISNKRSIHNNALERPRP